MTCRKLNVAVPDWLQTSLESGPRGGSSRQMCRICAESPSGRVEVGIMRLNRDAFNNRTFEAARTEEKVSETAKFRNLSPLMLFPTRGFQADVMSFLPLRHQGQHPWSIALGAQRSAQSGREGKKGEINAGRMDMPRTPLTIMGCTPRNVFSAFWPEWLSYL